MDDLKEALEYAVELANRGAQPQTAQVFEGVPYALQNLHVVKPPRIEHALNFWSLEGFAEFVNLKFDAGALANDKLLVHVEAPHTAVLRTDLAVDFRDREIIAAARYNGENGFKFGHPYDPEGFVIALQCLFAPNDDLARLAGLVGTITAEKVLTSADDGMTQTVGRRAGVALVNRGAIDNPFKLKPLRTFAEIDQPESPFVLRVHQGKEGELPRPALYECDNGAWKIAAMVSIRDYLRGKIADIPVLA